jgi:hypothetical protein
MQKTLVTLVSDLSDGPADQTKTFSVDNVSYEIDLSAAEVAAFTEALAPYVAAARRKKPAKPTPRSSAAERPAADDLHEIREWARANGLRVAAKGRVSREIREKFQAAKAA